MKKAKISLALVAGLVATIGLSSCNEATYKEGVVLTYKDATGQRVSYTAKELFDDYENSQSALSTNFDKVYELMIRKYYNQDSKKSELNQINKEAEKKVNEDMKKAEQNSETNGTSYATEFEKILSSHSVETIDEDFEYWQYQQAKSLFETQFYKDKNLTALRDYGFTGGTTAENPLKKDQSWLGNEITDNGYIKEKMPYHVRHILRKVSAESNNLTQGKITEDEATKLALVVTELAKGEKTFDEIATKLSEDSSNTLYGDLGKMDLDTSYVNEFKLGVYAYDTLYNKAGDSYKDANASKVAPVEDRTVSYNGTSTTVKAYFEQKGIGTIPYGAAVALASAAEIDGDDLGYKVNEGNEHFLPRNIIFNKYFNKHNVCVITPDDIPYNNTNVDAFDGVGDANNSVVAGYTSEKGTTNADYVNLPGFSKYKNQTIDAIGVNALTDNNGHIILAVRAGSSGSYEGIHFIIVERSALDEYNNGVSDDNGTTLAEYWTNEYTESANFPAKTTGEKKITYVNFHKQKSSTYKDRADDVTSWIKGYNTNISSFIFAWLVNDQSIEFADETFGNNLKAYVQNKITNSTKTSEKTRSDTWRTYAEYLIHQDAVRAAGSEDGTGELISETCAISYRSKSAKEKTGLWAIGGACYGK